VTGFLTRAVTRLAAVWRSLSFRTRARWDLPHPRSRAPESDRDMNAHYGIDAPRPWTALAYLKYLPAAQAA
jgi:hypothetical protein